MGNVIEKLTTQLSEINQNPKFGMMALKGNCLQHLTGGCSKGENCKFYHRPLFEMNETIMEAVKNQK